MLLGMARSFRKELGCPVISSLSGEDVFLDRLISPFRQQSQDLIRERAAEASGFVALNRYYADYMIEYMAVDAEHVAVVPGNAFGPGGDGFARMCYATEYSKIEEALHRMEKFMTRYG